MKPHLVARLVRAQLRRRRADLAPLAELAPAVGLSEAALRLAAARRPDLGVCGRAGSEQVWWLPLAPLAAGFEVVLAGERLQLRLPAGVGHRPLHISGAHVGPAPHADLNAPELRATGMGELGYTVARLSLMAEVWLLGSARRLFELIAHTWRTGEDPVWSSGRLHVHQADHLAPVAAGTWAGGATTHQLELVVWVDDDGNWQLVNLYPSGTHRTVFDEDGRP